MDLAGLPTNWIEIPLDEIAEVSAGNPAPQGDANFADDGVPFVRVQDMGRLRGKYLRRTADRVSEKGARTLRLMPAGTVLLTKSGASTLLNQRAILAQDSYVVSHIATVSANAATNPDWLYYWLKTVDAAKIAHGGNMPSLPLSRVKQIQCPLPPLHEQQRIVEKIETLFAELDKGEEALRAVQKLLARYRQSVLKAAVTGTLTADWRAANPPAETGEDLLAGILEARRKNWQGRGQYSEPVEPETEGLPELPQGWAWASLDQLLGHLTSGSRDWKQYYGRGSGTFIMAQNVRPMRFDLSQRFLVDPPPRSPDAARSQVALDDLLITIVGANTGDVCRFPLDIDEHYVCQSVALMRLVDTELSPFIEFFLSAKGAGRDQLEKHIYGAGRPHLSFEQLRSVAIPLPPKNECAELMRLASEAIANVARAEALCKSEAKRSTALRQSILKDAFSGKLVPQDPSDEPADKLLERIRAAHAEKPKVKRKKATA